jgi:predicted nucleic acid-binding Zn ribbon protein
LIRFCGRPGERLGGILHRELKKCGMARRLPRRLSHELWESAVGRQIAARAQPTVLVAGTLHVLVQDHRWRDQLDAARMFLIERLNARLGKDAVRQLQFGLAHEGALADGRRRAGIGLAARAEVAVEPVAVLGGARLDAGLREALLRAAEAAARRRG